MGFIQSPSWRPSWKFYHWTISALASVLCLAYMFMINWIASLVSIAVMGFVYKYIEYQGYDYYFDLFLTGAMYQTTFFIDINI